VKQTPNSKLEIRNPKQIQMIKTQKILNVSVSDFEFWICGLRFVSDFDIRISNFQLAAFCRENKTETQQC